MGETQTIEEKLVEAGFPEERVKVLLGLVESAGIDDNSFEKLIAQTNLPEIATGKINTLIMVLEECGATKDVFDAALMGITALSLQYRSTAPSVPVGTLNENAEKVLG